MDLTHGIGRKLLLLSVPALLLAVGGGAVIIEALVRWQWDGRRGTPGFFLSDPVLGLRLSPGYEGWFAGVPVAINRLGFRDPRDYPLAKDDRTFRVLVLGDSVTFGHGAVFETTYPRLLEERLESWRPDLDWQVWNLGVPGLNTSQELAYLLEVGEAYQPDLVIVGFFANDLEDNEPLGPPGALRRATSFLQRQMQRHLYSYELYRRVYLTARWRLRRDAGDLRRLQHMTSESALLTAGAEGIDPAAQLLTDVDTFTDEDARAFTCGGIAPDPRGAEHFRALVTDEHSALAPWLDAVSGFRRLHREGVHRVVFFINMAPEECTGQDRFFDAGSLAFNDAIEEVLGHGGIPVVSSVRAFLRHRPSQMPLAAGHSSGNANRVKADVLFEFLASGVLPPLLPPPAAH